MGLVQEVQELKNEYKNEKKETEKATKEAIKQEKYKKYITIFFILFNPITIILYIIIWGYFAFAEPVFKEHNNLGYDQTEPAYIDQETNRKLTKQEALEKYNK